MDRQQPASLLETETPAATNVSRRTLALQRYTSPPPAAATDPSVRFAADIDSDLESLGYMSGLDELNEDDNWSKDDDDDDDDDRSEDSGKNSRGKMLDLDDDDDDDKNEMEIVDLVDAELTRKDIAANQDGNKEDDDFSFDSQMESSVDTAAEMEKAIRDGFLGFLWGYISNDVFQKILVYVDKVVQWILRKIKGGDNDDEDGGVGDELLDDLVGETADGVSKSIRVLNASGGPGPGGGGGGGGGGAAGPPPGVAEMASAAANSAASAGASGAAAGAGAAGGLGGMAGMAGTVAGAGAASQAGVAIGVGELNVGLTDLRPRPDSLPRL